MSYQSGDPERWMLFAACLGRSDLFFAPDDSESRAERRYRESQAKSVCMECVVRSECLTEAMRSDERFGIWGGLTERERRAARRTSAASLVAGALEDVPGGDRPTRLPALAARGQTTPFDSD